MVLNGEEIKIKRYFDKYLKVYLGILFVSDFEWGFLNMLIGLGVFKFYVF